MTETITRDQADDVFALQRRRRRRRPLSIVAIVSLVVSVVVIGALAALVASLTQRPLYAAQTEMLFNSRPDVSDTVANRALATQELVLHSGVVLGPVSNATRIPITELEKALTTEVVGQSNVIRFSVTSADPTTAQTLAQLISDEYQKRATVLSPGYGLSVLTPVHVLRDPVRPRPVQALALGALTGVFIAAGMLLALGRPWTPRDDRSGLDSQ
jgi:capsular polysaccharide biosynthesis protein